MALSQRTRNRRFVGEKYLSFRCTGCGNCCREPLLPLTDADLRRIVKHTGKRPADVVRWVSRMEIDLDEEPEAFVRLPKGRRVMVLAHNRKGCQFLGKDDRCTIYGQRPLGCRVFPFDPSYTDDGQLKRLKLIQAADCRYELDGANDPARIAQLHVRYERITDRYYARVARWNELQEQRQRAGKSAQSVQAFFGYLGLG